MDIRRTLYVQGHGDRATALVELLRTKEYHSAKPGELIWRVELWYFQYSHGSWERITETDRVLRRERLPFEKWKALDVEYYPALSAYVDAAGFAKAVDFTIPDKPDPSRGRPKNTQPELATPPHVIGVEAKLKQAHAPESWNDGVGSRKPPENGLKWEFTQCFFPFRPRSSPRLSTPSS